MTDDNTRAAASSLGAERYRSEHGTAQLTGVQALVRLPLDCRRADVRVGANTAGFISGYEGSPLGGYDLELHRLAGLLEELRISFRPAVNEELGATAVMGSQLAGDRPEALVAAVTGFWYGKSPGLDRSADALRHANLVGSHPGGGAVALVGDDPGAKSSTVPGYSEALLADLGMPVFYPADSQDVLDLGLHAVAMSRCSGLWAAMKIVTGVADGAGPVQFGPDRIAPLMPEDSGLAPWRHRPNAWLLQPASGELEQSRSGIRFDRALHYLTVNRLDRVVTPAGPARVGIVAAGNTYQETRHALQRLGLDDAEAAARGLRVLKLAVIYPLVPEVIKEFADGLDEIIVIEEKRGFIESAIASILYSGPHRPALSGKRDPAGRELFRSFGELDADTITQVLARRLGEIGGFPSVGAWSDKRLAPAGRAELQLATRTPYFCSGCPHNSSTQAPRGALVGAGIGCHALTLVVAPERVGDIVGLAQMGGEGATWIGMSPFVERDHFIQNLGDGTFHHSGSLAVRASVAAGVNVTYKLLYNSAVAMTGGQHAEGARDVPDLCRLLLAEGVARIVVTTPDPRHYPHRRKLPRGVRVRDRDQLIGVQQELAAVPGVTVLIHDQECATELRRKRKRATVQAPRQRAMINERVCEGCGDCGRKSNCLSVHPVETVYGRKTRIDQSSCNLDFSCLEGDCPSFLSVTPARQAPAARPASPPPVLADKAVPRVERQHIRITGVGGSGVVTLAQILGRAATIAGYHVRGLDQTGLAQKGGAVISDLRFSAGPANGNRGASGECDLYLGCDALVAAEPRNLTVADPARTVAIVSLSAVPTGAMVLDPAVQYPAETAILSVIDAATRAQQARYLDARRAAVALLGSDQYANMLLAGMAFEAGALPVPADAIEAAIADNGAQVERNVAAFRWGRYAVADRSGFDAAAGTSADSDSVARRRGAERLVADAGLSLEGELAGLVVARAAELTAYQDAGYARRYVAEVAGVAALDPGRGHGAEIAVAVARHLFTLMAYKDEYEVARLSLAPEVRTQVEREFGAGARIAYRLHPPVLRALGMRRKITFGPWFRVVFTVLAAGRRLRGTPLDAFGWAAVRRTERALPAEYAGAVTDALGRLGTGDDAAYARALAVAEAAGQVRGYETIKLESVARFRTSIAELLAEPENELASASGR